MGDIEAMLREIVRIADDDTIGYSQPDRLGRHNVDCSELMRLGLLAGGWPINYLWTGNMPQELPRVGWSWHPGTDGIRRGDILWKQGHTAAYLGGGQRAEAWIAEDGSIDGWPGDQTGQEVRVHSPWNDVAWSGYFRAPAGSTYTSQSEEDDIMAGMTEERFKDLVRAVLVETKGNDGRNLLDSVIQTRAELKDRAADALIQTRGLDGRNILDRGIQNAYDIASLTARLGALEAVLSKVALGGVDPDVITQAARDGAAQALADLTLTAKKEN